MKAPRWWAVAMAAGVLVGFSAPAAASAKGHGARPAHSVRLVGAPKQVAPGAGAVVTAEVPLGQYCRLSATRSFVQLSSPVTQAVTHDQQWAWTVPKQAARGAWELSVGCAPDKALAHQTKASITVTVTGRYVAGQPLFQPGTVTHSDLAPAGFKLARGVAAPPPFGVLELAASNWLGGHGVDVISNGPNFEYFSGVASYLGGTLVGYKWQCVEMVDRLIIANGWAPTIISGNAVDWWSTASQAYFTRHPNGSGYTPVPGDIVVFSGYTYGHVAVVNQVQGGGVDIVEQNAAASGQEVLTWNGSTLGNEGGLSPIGFLHPVRDPFTNGPAPAPPAPPVTPSTTTTTTTSPPPAPAPTTSSTTTTATSTTTVSATTTSTTTAPPSSTTAPPSYRMGIASAQPCLNFHSGVGGAAPLIGCIPYGTAIPIMCTAQGNAVTGPWGTESVWDYTNWSGQDGWVSDAWVYTGVEGAVAPAC